MGRQGWILLFVLIIGIIVCVSALEDSNRHRTSHAKRWFRRKFLDQRKLSPRHRHLMGMRQQRQRQRIKFHTMSPPKFSFDLGSRLWQRPFPEQTPSLPSLGNLNLFHSMSKFMPDGFKIEISTSVKPWWEGPNVCKEETEKEENNTDVGSISDWVKQFFQCDASDEVYTCTFTLSLPTKKKTTTTRYQCCHGYEREKGEPGCSKIILLKTLIKTLEDVEAKELVKAIDSVGLRDLLSKSNFTIFAPSDEAFKKFLPELQPSNHVIKVTDEVMKVVEDMRNVLGAHVVSGILRISQLHNNQLLTTANPRAELRINAYKHSQQIVTANCVPVTSSNNLATNGIVHVVKDVLLPVYHTIMDQVAKRSELTILKKILGKTHLSRELKQPGGLTLFAPTDAAFSKLSPTVREMMLTGDDCFIDVLLNHLLPNVLCSAGINTGVKYINKLDKDVNVSRSNDDKLFVGHAQIIDADIMGTNGVMHIIDDIIIPEEALGLEYIAKHLGATEFIQLIKSANLSKQLETLSNVTFFIPTNQAIKKFKESSKDTMKDMVALKKVVKYHVATSVESIEADRLRHDRQLSTLDSDKTIWLHEHSYPFGLRRPWQSAQCAVLSRYNIPMCGGVVHLVDEVMVPPKGNHLDTLALHPQFSRLISLVKKAGMAEKMQDEKSDFTVLAPTNKAIEEISEEDYNILINDKEKLKTFLEYHMLQGHTCCAHFNRYLRGQTSTTIAGGFLSYSKDYKGRNVIGGAPIDECDISASNGVIHVINKVIPRAMDHARIYTRHQWPDLKSWFENFFMNGNKRKKSWANYFHDRFPFTHWIDP